MKKATILTILMFALSVMTAQMVMAQAKPAPAKPAPVKAAPAASKEPIKIGAIYDFAGGCHMYSESGVKGIKIALDEINAKGGILGRPVEFVNLDS